MDMRYKQRFKKIYVICAAYYKTGGTEVLHQLVFHINRLGGNADISYIRVFETPALCNPAYTHYVEGHISEIDDIIDSPENAIIIPEGYPEYNEMFYRAYKMLWWLSVDNFEGIYDFDDKKINKIHESFRDSIGIHLVQSEYAREYLIKKNVPENRIYHLGDYINDIYFEDCFNENTEREDIILYNPKKGEESTKNIIEVSDGLNFIPIKDMTNEEVRGLMRKAKIYMDFGNHPGKDRIPREAAMSGCIVVTGRHGSAANPVDIKIPDRYKLDESEVSGAEVVSVLKKSIDNYQVYINDFVLYKNEIRKEKKQFIEDIRRVFFDFSIEEHDYKKLNNNRILIVIVSYNSKHLMQENIKSIRKTVPSDRYKIMVVDNASNDGVAEWLFEQDDILLIQNEANVGFGPACNEAVNRTLGTEFEKSDIFLLNNDTRLTDNALYFLMESLYCHDDIGAVGSVSNYAGNHQQIDVLFDKIEGYLDYGKKNNIPMDNAVEERVRLSGFAMLIRREAWNKAGGFDEDFAPGYFEDDALSMELLKIGYRLAVVKNSYIYHAGSQSFSSMDYNTLLEDHRELFISKYGFDIMNYAYANEALISCIPYDREDTFNIVQIGCGLGAGLKSLRGKFPNCTVIGVEENDILRDIARNTESVFENLLDVKEAYGEHYFDIVLLDDRIDDESEKEKREQLETICKKNVIILTGNSIYKQFPFEKIKLVIWDLDDTLWEGILSETDVKISQSNINIIRLLADNGVVNSISSKNDEKSVEKKLKEAGIWELFVFNNINWNEKGSQIYDKLNIMGLRAENVLFIDDNPRNLEDAKYHVPGLLTAEPGIIPYLFDHFSKKAPQDIIHERLEHYKLLEKKNNARTRSVSKEQFLYDSEICIIINRNCLEEIDRIHELVMRTNQLNYTKNRDNKELLVRQITNDWNDSAYVKVRDRFGDYGVVGFYCYNTREKVMEHFLFSCRVLGMGIEQYVFNQLKCPQFSIKEPVASPLYDHKDVLWIKEVTDEEISEDRVRNNRVRVLLKGPCDMSAIEPYLAGGNITTEFNYVNDMGFVTTGQNHSIHIRESQELTENEIDEIIKEAPFIIRGDFMTKIFSQKYHVICFSLLQDLSAGLYRNKRTRKYISFSSRNFDLTDSKYAGRFIRKEIQGHDYDFTQSIISDFSSNWDFIGNTPLDMLLDNLDFIYENVQGKPLIILLLGSEIDYEGYNEEFDGLAEVYREINPVIKAFAEDHERVKVIDPTEFIRSQDDYEGCINHFSRNVYYEIAGKICEYINQYI